MAPVGARAVFASETLVQERAVNAQVNAWIHDMTAVLKENMLAGERVPKDRIPEKYLAMGFNNIYRYKITKSVRATYTIVHKTGLGACPHIIEIFTSHKDYEKVFGY